MKSKSVKNISIRKVKGTVPQYHTYITKSKILKQHNKKQKIFINDIEHFLDYLNIKIEHSQRTDAQYQITDDIIQMPFKSTFRRMIGITRQQNYYSTLFHEIGHWTGNRKRLKRKSLIKYDRDIPLNIAGSELAILEEVTVELFANMVMEFFNLQSSPSYLSLCFINKELSYLDKSLQEQLYIKGIRQATKAFNYLKKQYKEYGKEK